MSRLPWVDVQPCGTDAAYRRHRRSGERACYACLHAHALAVAESKQRRRARTAMVSSAGEGTR